MLGNAIKCHAGQWQHHMPLLQDDITARLIVSPCGTKKQIPSPLSVMLIDTVTATPLLADVIITTTASQLLCEFFWNLVTQLLSHTLYWCCHHIYFCLLMQMLLLLTPATAGYLLVVNYFYEFDGVVTFMHTGYSCCHIHFFLLCHHCQILLLLFQFAAWSLTNWIETIVADVASTLPATL